MPAYVLPFLDEEDATESDDDRNDISNDTAKARDPVNNAAREQCNAAEARGKSATVSNTVESGQQTREDQGTGRQTGGGSTVTQADAELATRLPDSHANEPKSIDAISRDGGIQAPTANPSIKEREAARQAAADDAACPQEGDTGVCPSKQEGLVGDTRAEAGREARMGVLDGDGKDEGEQSVRDTVETLDVMNAGAGKNGEAEDGKKGAEAGEAAGESQRELTKKAGGRAPSGRGISFQGCAVDSCLNAMLLTECTPGYCPCGRFCQNQVRKGAGTHMYFPPRRLQSSPFFLPPSSAFSASSTSGQCHRQASPCAVSRAQSCGHSTRTSSARGVLIPRQHPWFMTHPALLSPRLSSPLSSPSASSAGSTSGRWLVPWAAGGGGSWPRRTSGRATS